MAPEGRKLLAECVGTFALTTVAAGGEVVRAYAGEPSHAAVLIAPGAMVLALVFALGQVSGAHLNPAVTVAFALRRAFPWRRVPAYVVVQLAGATVAALGLRALFGPLHHDGATVPTLTAPRAVAVEAVLTFLLVTVILGTATRERLLGPTAAIPVGATVALAGLLGGPLGAGSMNPARSLGPALVGGALGSGWIFVAGPLLGAAAACAVTWLVAGPPDEDDVKAARGG